MGTEFTPITYSYSVPYVTNSRLSQLSVKRTITAPDIIFTAADLINSEAAANYTAVAVTNGFIQTTYASLGAGVSHAQHHERVHDRHFQQSGTDRL